MSRRGGSFLSDTESDSESSSEIETTKSLLIEETSPLHVAAAKGHTNHLEVSIIYFIIFELIESIILL